MTTPAEYAEFVAANGGKPGPYAVNNYRYSFYFKPGELGQGGHCVQPTRGMPRTQDEEKAVAAALAFMEANRDYDRAMVRRSGVHPTWLRPDGTRWKLPDSADLEMWGYCS